VTTSVTAKPVTFLHGTYHGCMWSLICVAVILPLLQENNFSNSMPNRVKCRTEAVKYLSRSLENWKMLKIIFSKLKFIN